MNTNTLTYRQWQVLQAIIDAPNLSHADRARRIGIAEHTFRSHLRHAYRALGVHSLTGALVKAMRLGLVRIKPLPRPPTPLLFRLSTPRRKQVLQSLIDQPDLNLAARARYLGMSPHTLDNHLRFIYEVLDVNNLNAALIMALRAGIVTVPKDEQAGWRVAA
jgi:DNA-binding CsgD family transcriptional regulator